jgi:UDP-glucose 4-epimerase
MNYAGKKIAITGADGFIGKALIKKLQELYGYVDGRDETLDIAILKGDTRDPRTFEAIDYSFDYLFHFAAPSSQVLFKAKPFYSADVTINGFMNAANAARTNGVKLIYPSTGILSFDRTNEYARCKKICEDIHLGENLNALGLRIFMGYGPGEGHKSHWASPAYLFAREMVAGRRPEVWGDGTQERDLIYIDDLAEAILILAEEATEQIIDIGTGNPVSFKDMILELNTIIGSPGLTPVYVGKPAGYVEKTAADPTLLHKYFTPKVDLKSGLREIVKELKGGQNAK